MRIAIANDSPKALRILRALVADQGGTYTVAGKAQSGGELLALLAATPCDLVITDFSMSDRLGSADGLAMLASLRERHHDLPVIVLTTVSHPLLIQDILAFGIHGLVSKEEIATDLLPAIQAVTRGQRHQSAQLRSHTAALVSRKWSRLTPREKQIAQWVGQGLTVPQIAERTQRHIGTIIGQKWSVMRKLGLSDEQQLQDYLRAMDLPS